MTTDPTRAALRRVSNEIADLPRWDKRSVPGGMHVRLSDVLDIIARATPPATEERCAGCAGNIVDGYCDKHEPSNATRHPDLPPATDPSAALVERLLDRLYPVTPNGRTGFAWKKYDATKADLDAIVAAARAEGLDGLVERDKALSAVRFAVREYVLHGVRDRFPSAHSLVWFVEEQLALAARARRTGDAS